MRVPLRRQAPVCITGLALGALLLSRAAVEAQLPNPALDFVYPPGGQPGKTVEVEIGGRDLDEAHRLVGSHPGLIGSPVLRPPKEFETEAQPVANRFRISIPVNLPTGTYDLRAEGRFGVSTPCRFVVSHAPQRIDSGNNHSPEQASPLRLDTTVYGRTDRGAIDYYRFTAQAGQTLVAECRSQHLDSQIQPRLTIWTASGRQLHRSRQLVDPVIPFTAPEDGDYLVSVHDNIYEGGSDRAYQLHVYSGPYLFTATPHVVRPDKRTELVVSGFNLAAGAEGNAASSNELSAAETSGRLTFAGQPLQQQKLTLYIPPAKETGTLVDGASAVNIHDAFRFYLPDTRTISNGLLLVYGQHDVVIEAEANDLPKQAQVVTLPLDLAGRFYPQRDQDWIEFPAKQGDSIQVQVVSQRLGLPTDPEVYVQKVVRKDDGTESVAQVSTRDDTSPDRNRFRGKLRLGLERAHRDPVIQFTADADAEYRIGLRDLNAASVEDPRLSYRLVVRRQRPRFQLLAWTQQQATDDDKRLDRAALVARRGQTVSIMIDAIRQGGFAEDIDVSVRNLPPGVTAHPCRIRSDESSGTLLLTVADDAAAWSGPLKIVGQRRPTPDSAADNSIASSVTARTAILTSGTDNVQRSRPDARPTDQLVFSVLDHERASVELKFGGAQRLWRTSRGAKLAIPVHYQKHRQVKRELALTAIGAPDHLKVDGLTLKPDSDQSELKLDLTNEKLAPGEYQFFLRGKVKAEYARNKDRLRTIEQRQQHFAGVTKQLAQQAKQLEAEWTSAEKLVQTKTDQLTKLAASHRGLVDSVHEANQRAAGLQTQLQPLLPDAQRNAETEDEKTESAQQTRSLSPIVMDSAAAESVQQLVARLEHVEKSLDLLRPTMNRVRKQLDAARAIADELKAQHQEAAAKHQRATEYAKQLSERLKAARKELGPKDVDHYVNSPPIEIAVAKSPVEIKLSDPTIAVKRGEQRRVEFQVDRRFGFGDEVTVEVELHGKNASIRIKPVTVAKKQTQSVFAIQVESDAEAGEHTGSIITKLTFNGVAIEDRQPVTVRVGD